MAISPLDTWMKHRRMQMIVLLLSGIFLYADAKEGQMLRLALGDLNEEQLLSRSLGLLIVLGPIAIISMMSRFNASGAKEWHKGGREQFAYSGGYSVVSYGSTAVFFVSILVYPYLKKHGITLFSDFVTIACISIVLTFIVGYFGSILLFPSHRTKE